MMREPRCNARNCKHFWGIIQPDRAEEGSQMPACKAFPKGIPDKIAYGTNRHTRPVKGDHGIQFEKEG